MTSFGSVRRGPMAADVFEREFTRIYNKALRDPRTSFKAKGLLAMLSTHRDGWGLTLELIASCATDGIGSVRAGLAELTTLGYLQRDRRRSDGTDGKRKGTITGSDYWITDMPEGLVVSVPAPTGEADEARRSAPGCENRTMVPQEQKPRSAPGCGFPQVDNPPEDYPQEENHRHKKTTSTEDQVRQKTPHHQEDAGARGGARLPAVPEDDEDEAKLPPKGWEPPSGAPPLSTAAYAVVDAVSWPQDRSPGRSDRKALAQLAEPLVAGGWDPWELAKYVDARAWRAPDRIVSPVGVVRKHLEDAPVKRPGLVDAEQHEQAGVPEQRGVRPLCENPRHQRNPERDAATGGCLLCMREDRAEEVGDQVAGAAKARQQLHQGRTRGGRRTRLN